MYDEGRSRFKGDAADAGRDGAEALEAICGDFARLEPSRLEPLRLAASA